MSRISYSDEESYGGEFNLWQANCLRSLYGKKGQAQLNVLREALLALPEKRLIRDALVSADGREVCAVGAYARYRGIDLAEFDPFVFTEEVGVKAGMPQLVAWSVVAMNDHELSRCTPEERYTKTLAWVERLIAPVEVKS